MIRTHYRGEDVPTTGAERMVEELSTSKLKPHDWLRAAASKLAPDAGAAAFVLLSGGADLIGFRLRVAQSHTRSDMLPSCFDHAALLLRDASGNLDAYHVPSRQLDLNAMVARNGIQHEANEAALRALLPDWKRTPNLALLRFPKAQPDQLRKTAEELVRSRGSDDFLTPLVEWGRYVLGTVGGDNPLLRSVSLPSASFVESCYAGSAQDITPGAAVRIAVPESIWQARFWPDYAQVPDGAEASEDEPASPILFAITAITQPAAAISWPAPHDTNKEFLDKKAKT